MNNLISQKFAKETYLKSATVRFLRCSPFDEYMVWKRWVENKSALAADRMNTLVKSLLLRYANVRLLMGHPVHSTRYILQGI